MNDAKNHKFDFYLEQVGESAKRCRLVLYLLLVSSAMIFVFDWRNNSDGWLKSRIDIRHAILTNWEQYTNVANSTMMTNDDLRIERGRELAALKRMDLSPQNPGDKEILEWQLHDLEDQWDGAFKIPFMDATFDINDFFLFSALELLVLAVIFLHCLVREEENLGLAFDFMRKADKQRPVADQAKPGLLAEFYDMASMQQVWTVPSGAHKGTESALRYLSRLVFLLPLLIIWWIMIRDRMSPGASQILNKSFGHEVIWMEYITVFLLTIAMFCATVVFLRMDKLWKQACLEVTGAKPPL